MEKLVVSSAEVASIPEVLPPRVVKPPAPAPQPKLARYLLAPLVLVLPALCVATVIIWLRTRAQEPRVRYAWLSYCCLLLVISGLLSSLVAGALLVLLTTTAPLRAAAAAPSALPFLLEAPVELPGAVGTEPLSPRNLASRAENTVFIVSPESRWFQPSRETLSVTGFGTAVLLFAGEKDLLFATSRHVLDGETWQRSAPYMGQAILWGRRGGFARAQIVGRHQNLDLMLLRLPRLAGQATFAQPVLEWDQVGLGERIMVFGHPEGLFFSLSDGLISRKDPASGHLQITAPVSPGASGGPVYDLRGRLLGIVSGMIDRRFSPHSENLNFAVRADSLRRPAEWRLEPAGQAALAQFIAATAEAPLSPHP